MRPRLTAHDPVQYYSISHINIYYRLSLALQIYVSMSRIDLARKELKKMQEKDEDSTLTQLAQAWINIALVKYIRFMCYRCRPSIFSFIMV